MLLARNFGEADYEALLELDNQPAMARPQLSEAELGRLRTHIHHLKAEVLPKRPPRLLSSSASSCSDKVLSAQGHNEFCLSLLCTHLGFTGVAIACNIVTRTSWLRHCPNACPGYIVGQLPAAQNSCIADPCFQHGILQS